ncbi:insulin-like growth factor binding protein [Cantharellus anzutake]|uniref:insulin-like growth factor binding protein n=1 Tax=Cantharellus anzutake TaxID=1750568 RepID=UPI001903ED55|nr:insulin-like growth factor binding protein [Cantharellus anzutake]KAF8344015.1 insulin-like growth factor binding protein [Cantharellus anzutake]
MLSIALFTAFVVPALCASSSAVTICSSKLCLQGNTAQTPLGATLSSPSISSSIILLPGTYDSSSSLPSLLVSALQSPLSTLSLQSSLLNASSGISGSISLPLSIRQSSSFLSFLNSNFTGTGVAHDLGTANATFSTAVLKAESFLVQDGVWGVLLQNSTGARMVVWESVSDLSQISSSSNFEINSESSLVALQSSSCPSPCSSSGTCNASGSCSCSPSFSGSACETCAPGFFGPECQSCPSGCLTCDDGPSGTGRCLSSTATNPSSSCNCLHGTCNSDGSCTCSSGWASSNGNSTQCSTCANGFFNNGDGECRTCELGCQSCTGNSGTCTSCESGLVQDTSTPSKCIVPASTPSCPDGQFNNGGSCAACSSLCKTCKGPSSTDCLVCGAGMSSLGGQCVSVSSNGVCSNPNPSNGTYVVNNAKNECDTCPSTCTACQIPGFSVVSSIDQVQCTACLPGYVLSGGKCLTKCPDGRFIDPKGDGFTCVACDSSCSTCAGSKTFCLSCSKSSSFALNGTCVSSCPSNSFASGSSCLPCHPDCGTCSGSGFDKCTSCSSTRPVLSSGGRCLLTCGKNEYYDSSSGGSGGCKSCDSSCSTCTSAGPSNCLTCPSGKILRQGQCVDALCTGGNAIGIVNSLGGICLSSLVTVAPGLPLTPVAPTTSVPTPTRLSSAPTISDAPRSGSLRFAWWQILLVSFGTVAIIALCLILWRQRARKARQDETMAFKQQKLDNTSGWRGWFGFGSSSKSRALNVSERLRESESWRYEMERMEGGYTGRRASVIRSPMNQHFGSDVRSRRAPSIISALSSVSSFTSPTSPRERKRPSSNIWTEPSVYSQPTERGGGKYAQPAKRSSPPPPIPEYNRPNSDLLQIPRPRQPIKDTSTARYSNSFTGNNILIDLEPDVTGTTDSSHGVAPNVQYYNPPSTQPLVDVPVMPANTAGQTSAGSQWISALNGMPSSSDRNPFRRQL